MTYPTVAWNPSDMCDVKNVRPAISLTASKTFNLATGVDVSLYEYVLVIADLGSMSGTGTVTVTLQHSDTALVTGGGYVAVTSKTMTFAATADNNSKALEVRCHPLKQYMNVNIVRAAGGSCTLGCKLLGFGRQYSVNYASFTSSMASLGSVTA